MEIVFIMMKNKTIALNGEHERNADRLYSNGARHCVYHI